MHARAPSGRFAGNTHPMDTCVSRIHVARISTDALLSLCVFTHMCSNTIGVLAPLGASVRSLTVRGVYMDQHPIDTGGRRFAERCVLRLGASSQHGVCSSVREVDAKARAAVARSPGLVVAPCMLFANEQRPCT